MLKKLMLSVGFIFIGSVFYATLLYYGIVHLNNPSWTQFPVRGIDVSHHQGEIDWQHLPRNEVQFAYIKATEGGDFKDPDFQRNWQQSKAVGIVHGAYHYFNFCRDGIIQARNFIESVPVEQDALPPAIDIEPSACEEQLTQQAIITALKTLLDELQRVYGKPPLFYVTQETYERYVRDHFPQPPLWVRDVYWQPHWTQTQWVIWQYDSRTRMAGINTYVDRNVRVK